MKITNSVKKNCHSDILNKILYMLIQVLPLLKKSRLINTKISKKLIKFFCKIIYIYIYIYIYI